MSFSPGNRKNPIYCSCKSLESRPPYQALLAVRKSGHYYLQHQQNRSRTAAAASAEERWGHVETGQGGLVLIEQTETCKGFSLCKDAVKSLSGRLVNSKATKAATFTN